MDAIPKLFESWTVDGDPDAPATIETPTEPTVAEPIPIRAAPATDAPPSPDAIAEAMLFAGGPPLTAEKFAAILRAGGDLLHRIVADLNKRYRNQNRPYSVQPRDGGYVLAVKPAYRGMREKLFGGPREARLSQPALDVLSVIAYRQPVDKDEIDTIRGVDSGGVVRQLARLGLIAVVQRGESERPETKYGTTHRFLEIFSLGSLDDLPRLGEAQQL
jgi:segregation and condensation protein B